MGFHRKEIALFPACCLEAVQRWKCMDMPATARVIGETRYSATVGIITILPLRVKRTISRPLSPGASWNLDGFATGDPKFSAYAQPRRSQVWFPTATKSPTGKRRSSLTRWTKRKFLSRHVSGSRPASRETLLHLGRGGWMVADSGLMPMVGSPVWTWDHSSAASSTRGVLHRQVLACS